MTMQPFLTARFQTDERGAPEFVEANGLRHYKVVFQVKDPPEGAYAATFELDPTYYDPMRTLRPDPDGGFQLETTAYGDYDVKVRLRTKEGVVPLLGNLKRALEHSRESMGPNSAIDEAIEYIASH